MYYFAEVAVNSRNYDIPWYMYASIAGVLIIYALIEALQARNERRLTFSEASAWSLFYILSGILFSIPVYIFIGSQASVEYLAAWSVEKALSLDNLFVFGLIFTSFNVPHNLRRRMLNYGIAGAIFFRLIFILLGYELLQKFSWVSIIFGVILLRAAWHTFQNAKSDRKHIDMKKQKLWKLINKILPVHNEFVGKKLTVVIKGKRMLTLMAAVIILIELTDIIFAIDSVPAVLAVSPDRFIAYSSNVFAILGLRALYFVYDATKDMFWALNWALSGMLAWIAGKMMLAPFGFHIPVGLNISVIALFIACGIGISLVIKPRVT